MTRRLAVLVGALVGVLLCPALVSANSSYGSGNYGACAYESCAITLSSNGSLSLNVTPTTAGQCTIQSDTVSVLTDNTGGYSLVVNTSTTSTSLANGGNNITASSGTPASPQALTANTWGFRVDSLSGFGAGPTTSQSNISIPATTFAGVPASNQTSATIATTSSAANPAQNTAVWYGACINTSVPGGTYTIGVTYTATAN